MPGNLAAKILLLFRDSRVSDWTGLLRVFEKEDDVHTYGIYRTLHPTVGKLLDAKLLIAENASDFRVGSIKLAPDWWKIQNTLGFSLTQLANVEPNKAIFTQPLFEKPRHVQPDDILDLFVIMPFKDELKPIYDDHITSVAATLSLKVRRADDFFNTHSVMDNVWTAIYHSRIIIADCTGRNPNVFYEIGIAHTVGKPVILITQNTDDVPFDLRHILFIRYTYNPQGMKVFESHLKTTIETELRELGSR